MDDRNVWPRDSHEGAVERLYSRGVNGQTDIHRGYLNFGLWETGNDDYVRAAEHLVGHMGSLLGLAPGSRLLDVACGNGTQDVFLQQARGPLQIDALDVTWPHVERARRRVAEEGLSDCIRVHHGSATELPFAERSFTHLMSIEGPEHFRTRRRFFAEARRVLVADGVMALADYVVSRPPRTVMDRLVFRVACALWKVPLENVWSVDQYRAELRAAGFTNPELELAGARTFPGYYREQCRPAFRREMERLQGRVSARVGMVINYAAMEAYRRGIIDYVFVCAVVA
jgi:ubiquinone/menaquinone biosynthesis C-methylase UbiE